MSTPTTAARPGCEHRLARMVHQPTVSGDAAAFAAFVAVLEADYPLVHEHLARELVGESGLLYRWAGVSSERVTVLMAHYDVVPVDAGHGWDEHPFSGAVRDGFVWGRGTLDDKGPLLVIVEAVENLLAAGFVPEHDIYLSFGGNEETYGGDAIAASELFRELGIVPWLVLDEGGAIVDAPLSFVPVTSAMVGVGEKGIVTARLVVSSAGGHASAPPSQTTAATLARAILRLQRSPFRVTMQRPFREMIARFEPHVPLRYRLLLRALRTFHPIAARILASRGGEQAALMRTTVVATMLDGGSAANVLPASLSATLNLRVAQGETVDSVLQTLWRAINDDSVVIELDEGSEPSPLSPTDNAQFALIASAVEQTHPGTVTAPYIMMAATDSRHFHRFSPAVYRFTPLEMDAAQRASIHGANERVAIASLKRGERFFQVLIRSLG